MLTRKEKQVLDIIENFIEKHHYSPTFEEIAHALGIKSKSTIFTYIKSLKEKNYIYIPEGKRKHIELIKNENTHSLPLIGTIAAGQPLDAYEVIDSVNMQNLMKTKDRYLLKISGDSMIDSGIMDGDLVLIQRQQIAKDGQIVVALVDDSEATLKEFRMQSDTSVALIPHNKEMPPMIYPANRISIQGIYLGLRFDRSFTDNT